MRSARIFVGLRAAYFPVRCFSATKKVVPKFKVAVVGAAGGIGQPLSLLLKAHPAIKELRLQDVNKVTPGVACDLSHIPTASLVKGYVGDDQLNESLKDADLVIVPAGVPRKPGMTRDDLFNTNAGIVAKIAKGVAQSCPKAQFLIISNPVNSTVPVAAEILTRMNAFDPKRLFGVTTLDVLRTITFVNEILARDGKSISQPVNVIGGHAGITILPLLSQIKDAKFTDEQIAALTKRIMFGGDEVVKAKDGAGSATLSMAQAGAAFASQVLDGLLGLKDISGCSFVKSDVCTDKEVTFFSSRVTLGKDGITKILGPGEMSAFEKQKYAEFIPELKDSINKGIDFARAFPL